MNRATCSSLGVRSTLLLSSPFTIYIHYALNNYDDSSERAALSSYYSYGSPRVFLKLFLELSLA